MSSLHILSTSPGAGTALDDCLRIAGRGDTLLLVLDGVYAARMPQARAALLAAMESGLQVYALLPDTDARGLAGHLPAGIRLVDDNGFVELTERHPRCLSWY